MNDGEHSETKEMEQGERAEAERGQRAPHEGPLDWAELVCLAAAGSSRLRQLDAIMDNLSDDL